MTYAHNPNLQVKPGDLLEYLAPTGYGKPTPPIFYKVISVEEESNSIIVCKLELLADIDTHKFVLPGDHPSLANLRVFNV